jgi:hypothetical protein
MKRLTVAPALLMLALPGGALAAARTRSFNARVLRSSALQLVLRRLDGRTLRYSAGQITGVPGGATASGDRREPVAHMAGGAATARPRTDGPRSAGSAIPPLNPGILVRVTETVGVAGRPAVKLGLPAGAAGPQHAAGVISAVSGASFLLDTAGGLELRLQGAVAGLRTCDTASVTYHQDTLTLVADSVRDTGRSSCAA